MTELKRQIGGRIRALRQDQRLTQEQLAERAEIHPTFLVKIEAGQRLPSLVVLQRLAGALGVPVASVVSPVDAPDGVSRAEQSLDELVALLRGCTREELEFVREFVVLLKRHTARS